MPIRREYPPNAVEAADVKSGRVDAQYTRVLSRLLAAHAMAEKLTALGYERAIQTLDNSELEPILRKNLGEERKHARLIYRALEEIGISQQAADRSMITVIRAPSFDAPRYFAGKIAGELDFLMASLSVDSTGLIMIGVNYKDSSYAPHARAAEVILEEEAEHDLFALEQLGQAIENFGREAVQVALRGWVPRAVNFFGPPGSGFTYDCLRFGLKARDNNELAELYVTMLEKKCGQLGLEMPRLTATYPHSLAN